ncbi:XdhC/CoxI family protein [Coleofasciculus sp. FACHB-1120]|uniref:XdhC family protein n=1 Tax=Coleofasciculus sp. FACHB-1120 TaxID=2692783 RepID=UPI00168313B3|nr:XdhC/CoxI family protein [Coleofasciculus sp. FACHB-1120]MBD2743907.1 XdhC family protein [Coleofasciculus sp. FACHB-1120]
MKELQEIIAAFAKAKNCGKTVAIATIVKVSGSTYRRPGARMLINLEGERIGSISGGCLENDVFERSQQVIVSGKPLLVNYDTTSDNDIVWGLGLGCKGMVQVLIERLTPENEFSPMTFLAECLHQRQVGVLATTFHIEGQIKAQVGTHLMLHQDGTIFTNLEDADLSADILEDARKVLDKNSSQVKLYALRGGKAEVFLEAIQPPVSLVIFGAGDDAIPVVRLAKELGWYVRVIDSRPANAQSDRFPSADEVILSRPEIVNETVEIDNRTVAVVMTHNYLHDLEILKTLLPSPVQYLGILGPKRRTEQLLLELKEEGMYLTEAQLHRLHGPVGLDIGADTPEAIALSIVAEIHAVLADHSGGLLRNRKQPIHNRSTG